jgi:hypothetical protein
MQPRKHEDTKKKSARTSSSSCFRDFVAKDRPSHRDAALSNVSETIQHGLIAVNQFMRGSGPASS